MTGSMGFECGCLCECVLLIIYHVSRSVAAAFSALLRSNKWYGLVCNIANSQKPYFECRQRKSSYNSFWWWWLLSIIQKMVLLLLLYIELSTVAYLVWLAAWMMVVVIFIYPHLMPCFFFPSFNSWLLPWLNNSYFHCINIINLPKLWIARARRKAIKGNLFKNAIYLINKNQNPLIFYVIMLMQCCQNLSSSRKGKKWHNQIVEEVLLMFADIKT